MAQVRDAGNVCNGSVPAPRDSLRLFLLGDLICSAERQGAAMSRRLAMAEENNDGRSVFKNS